MTSGGTPSLKVAHTYDTKKQSLGNWSRITELAYPNTKKITYEYGTSGGLNDTISRIASLREVTLFSIPQAWAEYSWIGMSGVGVIDNAKLDVQLNYKLAHNGGNPNGEYGSLDRFGRVIRHAWTDGNFTTHATDTTVPNLPPIVEMAYGFDRVSNVVSAYDDRPGARMELSHKYTYDDLHRLQEAERGLWDNSGTPDTFTKKKNSQRFTLDMLQNFKSIETDANGADR